MIDTNPGWTSHCSKRYNRLRAFPDKGTGLLNLGVLSPYPDRLLLKVRGQSMPEKNWIGTVAGMCILALLLDDALAFGQKKLDPLQFSLGDLEVKGAWIYNDVQAGFAEARKASK